MYILETFHFKRSYNIVSLVVTSVNNNEFRMKRIDIGTTKYIEFYIMIVFGSQYYYVYIFLLVSICMLYIIVIFLRLRAQLIYRFTIMCPVKKYRRNLV